MEITFFGFVWLTLIIIAMINNNNKFMTNLLLFSMVLQSNSILIVKGNLGIGPQIITSSFFLLKHSSFFIKRKDNMNYLNRNTIFFSLFVFSTVISSILNNILNGFVFLNILMLIIYYLVFLILSGKDVGFKKEEDIRKIIYTIIIFVLIIGLWQLLVEYSILSNRKLLEIFIYSDNIGAVAFNRFIVKRFYSTFMEPSYTSAFLTACISYLILDKKNKNMKSNIILILLFMALILTKSTTGYLTFVIITAYWILKKNNLVLLDKITVIYSLMFFVLIILIIKPDLLSEVLFLKKMTGSYRTRTNWNTWALESFQKNPILGIGFTQQRASSLLLTLLAEVGLVGTSFYFLWVLNLAKINRKLKLIVPFSMVISVIINQLIASPDINLSIYWFTIYVYGMYIYNNKITQGMR